jgi:hypothetical protein
MGDMNQWHTSQGKIVTITNRTSGILGIPGLPGVLINPSDSIDATMSSTMLEASKLTEMQDDGLITFTVVDDPDIDDAQELATMADVSGAAGAVTLDDAYDAGTTITADAGAVTVNSVGPNAALLADSGAGYPNALELLSPVAASPVGFSIMVGPPVAPPALPGNGQIHFDTAPGSSIAAGGVGCLFVWTDGIGPIAGWTPVV